MAQRGANGTGVRCIVRARASRKPDRLRNALERHIDAELAWMLNAPVGKRGEVFRRIAIFSFSQGRRHMYVQGLHEHGKAMLWEISSGYWSDESRNWLTRQEQRLLRTMGFALARRRDWSGHPLNQPPPLGNYQKSVEPVSDRTARGLLASEITTVLVGPMRYAGGVSLRCERIEAHLTPAAPRPSERAYLGTPVRELRYGRPLPGVLRVPQRHGLRVARLVAATRRDDFPYKEYLRYYLGFRFSSWESTLDAAESILDGTYKWDRDGLDTDDEGNYICPEGFVFDPRHWVLLDRHGKPTLDRRKALNARWHDDPDDVAE